MIRAKFRCRTVARHEGAVETETVTLVASNSKDGDNKDWSQWTPNGELTMSITNPEAQGKFKPGKHYFIDFTEVE